jgi:hypothetical protein
MNKSFSKIRHIQEVNLNLEKRMLSEQVKPAVSNQSSLPLNPQQISEFINYAQTARQDDYDGNGQKSKNAIQAANMFCITHRNNMFKNSDFRQPVVPDPNGVQAASQAIDVIKNDLSGVGSPIGGLSQQALNKVKGLMDAGGSSERDNYLKVQRVCMLFNGYSNATKEYLANDLAGDIEGDFGQQHDSWWMAANSIFGLVGY